MFPSRMAAIALGALGIMAAMLSITGLFGLAAHSVSKRMKELGIRIALGVLPPSTVGILTITRWCFRHQMLLSRSRLCNLDWE
jgi:hypothetical protein